VAVWALQRIRCAPSTRFVIQEGVSARCVRQSDSNSHFTQLKGLPVERTRRYRKRNSDDLRCRTVVTLLLGTVG